MEDKLGTIFDVPFEVTLNTDSVAYDINVMGVNAPKNLANNGIVRDGGLTEVYSSIKPLVTKNSVYHTSNGNKVYIDSTGHKSVYINDVKQFELDTNISFREELKIKGYGDCSISATGTFLCLRFTGTQFILDELNDAGTVINTKSANYSAAPVSLPAFCIVIDNTTHSFANSLYVVFCKLGATPGTNAINSIDFTTSTVTQIIGSGTALSLISAYKVGSGYVVSFDTTPPLPRGALFTGAPAPPNKMGITNAVAPLFACYYNDTTMVGAFTNVTFGGIQLDGQLSKNWYTKNLYIIGDMHTNPSTTIFCVGTITYAAGHIVATSCSVFTGVSGQCSHSQFGAVYQMYQGAATTSTFLGGTIIDLSLPWAVNTASTERDGAGGGVNYNVMFSPDCAFILAINTTTFLSVKNTGGSNALLTLSNTKTSQGNALCSLGDIYNMSQIFFYQISNNESGKILFRNSDGNYSYIRYGNDIDFSYSEIDKGVVSISCSSMINIIDTNKKTLVTNCSTFITSTVAPMVVSSTVGTDVVNFFAENEYSQCVDLGSYTAVPIGNLGTDSTTGQAITKLFSTYLRDSISDIYVYVNGRGRDTISNAFGTINPIASFFSYTISGAKYTGGGDFTYIPSPYEPIPITSGYDFRNGMALLNNGSAVGAVGLTNYDGINFLLQKYDASFRLFGQLYAFDGEYIYNLPLSAGSSGTVGTPILVSIANGLRYLCVTPQAAIFISDFDNSIFTFNGGRDVQRLMNLSQKAQIIEGAYCVANEELVMKTTNSLIYSRTGIISEMPEPYTPYTSYSLQESRDAVWAVHATDGSSTAFFYKAVSGGVIVPLSLQTSYYGYGSNRMKRIRRIAIRMQFKSFVTSQIILKWNWVTEDSSGTTANAVVTPIGDANGYAVFDYIPSPAYVLGGSLSIISADATQKIVLLSITAYIHADADAQTLNHAL